MHLNSSACAQKESRETQGKSDPENRCKRGQDSKRERDTRKESSKKKEKRPNKLEEAMVDFPNELHVPGNHLKGRQRETIGFRV